MKEEVTKYPELEKADLLEAAETWRLPYWDWAMKKRLPGSPAQRDYNVPLVLSDKKVYIRLPTKLGYGPCNNAFYQFTMPGEITMGHHSLGNKEDPLKDLRIHGQESRDTNGAIHVWPVSTHLLVQESY